VTSCKPAGAGRETHRPTAPADQDPAGWLRRRKLGFLRGGLLGL